MKIALVYDWLNTKVGGGEQVLLELAALYPDAPIYTLMLEPTNYADKLDLSRIHTSSLQHYPKFLRHRARYLLPLIPKAVESFDLSDYDLVISISSAWSKNVITKPETLHICYCFSPMRFAWDYWPRYIDEQSVGALRRAYIHRTVSRIRLWDYYGSKRVNIWIAISQTVANRISKYYRQNASVIYPPVDTEAYKPLGKGRKDDYYITLATLTPYKKIDLAIAACNQSGRKLIVIGDGPDRLRLQELAGSNIHFAGRVDQSEKARLLTSARGLIFPNEEDFGIAPIEALASGTPVVAYNRGGLAETIADGKTGVFFSEPTAESLIEALDRSEALSFTPAEMLTEAAGYNRQLFATSFTKFIEESYAGHLKKNR